MIPGMYPSFHHWAKTGSVWLLSDLHFDDADCKDMDPDWIAPDEQIAIINRLVAKGDTFVCLGDVGCADYVRQIQAKQKILIKGNHDRVAHYTDVFDEIYEGPVFIAKRILLSHEPVHGLSWCLNIHGHDHNEVEPYQKACPHLNLAANVCSYTPVSLGKLIRNGILSDIKGIHRVTIEAAKMRKQERLAQEG